MKIVLVAEGLTERELRPFLKRWLDSHLSQPPGLQVVHLNGSDKYLDEIAIKTELYLTEDDVIAVFGLLDLYGLPRRITDTYPRDAGRDEKIALARQYITNLIGEPIVNVSTSILPFTRRRHGFSATLKSSRRVSGCRRTIQNVQRRLTLRNHRPKGWGNCGKTLVVETIRK